LPKPPGRSAPSETVDCHLRARAVETTAAARRLAGSGGHSVFARSPRPTGMLTRGSLDVEDLLKIVLLLVVVLLVLEIVEALFGILVASIGPILAGVIVVLIVAYLLDYI
jgi:hypothetical protein